MFLEYDRYGLFNVPFHDSLNNVDQTHGLRIDIHERGTLPNVKLSGRNIMPGSSNDIKVKQTNRKRIGGRYGKCTKRKYLRSLETYRYSNKRRIDICKAHFVFEKCGCVSSDIPISDFLLQNKASYCGKIARFQINNYPNLTYNVECEVKATREFLPKDCSSCQVACDFTEYTLSMSQSGWPQYASVWAEWRRMLNSDSDSVHLYLMYYQREGDLVTEKLYEVLRSNYVRLNIYFESTIVTEITEYPLQ